MGSSVHFATLSLVTDLEVARSRLLERRVEVSAIGTRSRSMPGWKLRGRARPCTSGLRELRQFPGPGWQSLGSTERGYRNV